VPLKFCAPIWIGHYDWSVAHLSLSSIGRM
jgi:hypothetical protein